MLLIGSIIFNPIGQAPRNWEHAVGYPGDARYVGFYWEFGGEEAAFFDGRLGLSGANWTVFLEVADHLSGAAEGYTMCGSSEEEEAARWLVLDRATRWLYVLPQAVAQPFLYQQHPPEPPMTRADVEQLAASLQETLSARLQVTILRRIRCCPGGCLHGWLHAADGGYDPCPTCGGQGYIEVENPALDEAQSALRPKSDGIRAEWC